VATRETRAWLPWLLCAVSLVLIAVGGWLRVTEGGSVPAEPWAWLETILVGLAMAGIPLVGALIASRLPANPYGWLWCAIGLVVGAVEAARPVTVSVGGPLWGAGVVEAYAFAALVPLLVLAVLLFPTGRLPSRGWRWLARAVVAASGLVMLAGPFLPIPSEPAAEGPWVLDGERGELFLRAAEALFTVTIAFGLTAVWAQLLRYRRAGPTERRQLAWFLYASVLAALLLVLNALGPLPWRLLSVVLSAVSLALFPAAVLVAVLRYRLYEIDRIVSRTVTYALLTAAIFVVYLLVVTVLSQLGLPEGSSDVVVAVATLAVAALIGRVRRRLQAVVDRRFDRARYDAARAVDAFAARLRNQVNLDEVIEGLRDTVSATVAPSRVAVWLRPVDPS
jgi:hypothetical protein